MIQRGYGYIRDTLDHRDAIYALPSKLTAEQLPAQADVSNKINWVYDQGQENSCVAHGCASLIRYYRQQNNQPLILPSRNFIYWNARALDNPVDTNRDDGTQIRNGLQSVSDTGFCAETSWGYSSTTVFNKPPLGCFTAAGNNRITSYHSINQDHTSLRSCLASGTPFIFGMEVFKAFESEQVAETGIVPMPGANDTPIGAHCITAVGYDDTIQKYKILNSWGAGWGLKGYFLLDYAFVESQYICDDFWTISITAPAASKPAPSIWGWNPFSAWPWT